MAEKERNTIMEKMKTLQDKIEFIFTVTFDGSGTQYSMINKAIQELREEIKRQVTNNERFKDEYSEGFNNALETVLSLIGEKK